MSGSRQRTWSWVRLAPFLALAACSGEATPPIRIDPQSTVTFRTGFAVRAYQSGTLQMEGSPERTFYFANTSTHRRLKRFDHEGNLLQEVDLARAMAEIRSASGVQMMGPDRIIVFNEHCTRYAVVDGAGAVVKVVELATELIDTLGFRYELGSAGTGANVGRKDLVLRAYCRENVLEPRTYATMADEILDFYRNEGRSAHMAMLMDPLGEPKVRFGLYGYYQTCNGPFDGRTRDWGESRHFRAEGEDVLVYSYFSPWIHRLDENVRTLDSTLVESDEGVVFVTLPPLDSIELGHMQDSTNVRMRRRSISTVLPLLGRDRILVCIKHAEPVQQAGMNTPDAWTYQLRERDGSLVAEVPFLEPTHESYFMIQHSGRVWVKRASTTQESRAGILHFDELIIE